MYFYSSYLSSGNTFIDLPENIRLGISTIRELVIDICKAIWGSKDMFSRTKMARVAADFERKANFPKMHRCGGW